MEVEELKKIIETSSCINFGNFGQGVDNNIITTAENKLNFTFPEEYKIWLKNYSGGEINGEEILGIFNSNFEVWPNTVFANLKLRKHAFITNNELAIQMNDQAEIYFFKKNDDKVYLKWGNIEELYADSFFDFIVKKSSE